MKREDLEHLANTAALVRARVEFAVAVGSRSPFPKAVVAVGVDAAVAKERLQIMSARLDGFAAVEHCGANPRPCQSTTVGLVAFTAALERYFIRPATWLETALFAAAAAGLFWTELWADLIGWAAFVLVVLLQKFYNPRIKGDTK